mmetsp:Transcript_33860/g.49781  ORF Transcript_33860/g.49781 Transcript_33860/m.49781 type:complete len:199 (+) Transcript_33860:78-674(+)
MKKVVLIVIASANMVGNIIAKSSPESNEIELPRNTGAVHCGNNAVIASWCEMSINPTLECMLYPDFDEYVCACFGDHSQCPSECIGGKLPHQSAHYWTQCRGIPVDQPNYVLNKGKRKIHCAENAVVAGWCDEGIDENLECALYPEEDAYVCYCKGHHTECREDCVKGTEPLKKNKYMTYCKGIPEDQPNYIIKPEVT